MSCRIINALFIFLLFPLTVLSAAVTQPWDNNLDTADDEGSYIVRMEPQISTGRTVAVAAIKTYQKLISHQDGPNCRYTPTCSHYGLEAIQKYGIIPGGLMAADRWLRCNRWGSYGYDPVEDHYFGKKHSHDNGSD